MSGKKFIAVLAATSTLVLTLTGCGSSAGTSKDADSADSSKPITLTVWTGNTTPTKAAAKLFEQTHKNVTIKVETVTDSYNALDNAIQANSGVPDVMEFEYVTVPYFAIQNKLEDLSKYGASNDDHTFVDGAWTDVSFNGKPYAIPMDYGPTVMFYNEATFKKAGIDHAPATWDEYYEDAKKIHALGDKYYIVNEEGDIFTLLSMIWQAGGRPFKVDGEKIKVNLNDEGTKKAIAFYQKLNQEGLVGQNIKTWSDDWNRALNDGTVATQIIGGWLTSSITGRAPEQSGNFRVAPMPQWKAGEDVSAETGGSGFAIPQKAEHKKMAWEFLKFLSYDDKGVQARVDAGVFPPNTKVLKDSKFLDYTDKYFGDQKFREVIAQAADHVGEGWQYLPYMTKARDLYTDNIDYSKVVKGGSLFDQMNDWAKKVIAYGNEQGFSVSQ